MENADKFRCRNWVMLLYPEDETHKSAILTLEHGGFKYAAILHDKDTYVEGESEEHEAGELKKPHWHVVLKFDNAVWNTSLSKQLGIKSNYLEACVDFDDALVYLIHLKHLDKYQYDVEEVFGTLLPALKRLLVAPDEGTRILTILDEIDSYTGGIDAESYKLFFRKMCSNGLYGEMRRAGHLLDRYISAHNQTIYEELAYREKGKLSSEGFGDYLRNGGSSMNFADRCAYLEKKGFPPKPL